MYNRYVNNDAGIYRRIDAEHTYAPPHHTPKQEPHTAQHNSRSSSPLGNLLGADGLLSGILGKLKLSEIDSGDLLLLVILFLLFRDGEDEELLIALGLVLIL